MEGKVEIEFQERARTLVPSLIQILEGKFKKFYDVLDFITLTKSAMEVVEQHDRGKLSGAEKHYLVILILREFTNRLDIPEKEKNELREMVEQSADSLITCIVCVSKGLTKINKCCKKECRTRCQRWFGCIIGLFNAD
jgi:hypothetical protein